ncbi:hypothetical protein CJ030_MR2G001812 [Morella rubra]|uniref:Uncharacterized protein n=1 Tax=Morella rubra TaxID=262757 RepID=A0A6A1WBJ7_9ROSI|nr:hypothetical protein CJ030_MR2G001812 [Morella rubra]
MEHVAYEEEAHWRKVVKREVGERSSSLDPPAINATNKEHRYKMVLEAGESKENQAQAPATPKIQKVVILLRDRRNFAKFYEPRAVSLGPIHQGKEKYRLAEKYKLKLAKEFVKRSGKDIRDLCKEIEQRIKELRKCFEEEDLFLLENQLPYCLLKYLMSLSKEENEYRKSIENFIRSSNMLRKDQQRSKEESTHSQQRRTERRTPTLQREPAHLLELLRTTLLGEPVTKAGRNENGSDWQTYRSVQELKAAGIKLKCRNNCFLTSIDFTRRFNLYPGYLWLPSIIVDDSTGPKFMNLVAYELCPDFDNGYEVTTYITFLNSLINEANDVKQLRKERILNNFLGNDNEVAQLFNEMGTDLMPNLKAYEDVRHQIQDYYDNRWMTWIAQFFHAHLSSPLTMLALFGALLALALCATQTWMSK